VVLEIGGRH